MKTEGSRSAVLALADGTVFRGAAFGAERGVERAAVGEVVFNTSLFGYQEILTDPSYAGQIMTFTCPHIGNVGCNPDDNESDRVHAAGVLVRSLSREPSSFRATGSLHSWLERAGVTGVSGIDTRALVKHLRQHGSQMGAIAGGRANPSDLVDLARQQGTMEGKDYVSRVTCSEPYSWNGLPWEDRRGYRQLRQDKLWSRPHVVAIDCGVKHNILRMLLSSGFRVTVVPSGYGPQQILDLKPDALFISNGPGDPAALPGIAATIKGLLGSVPAFGICLGHQLLGLALGGKTFKLKFGHRGGNHPVIDHATGRVEITVQNHGFAVAADSLPKDVRVTHLNLNDRTVEGLDLPELRLFAIQYHPEASPGPHDARYLFDRFFESAVGYRNGAQ